MAVFLNRKPTFGPVFIAWYYFLIGNPWIFYNILSIMLLNCPVLGISQCNLGIHVHHGSHGSNPDYWRPNLQRRSQFRSVFCLGERDNMIWSWGVVTINSFSWSNHSLLALELSVATLSIQKKDLFDHSVSDTWLPLLGFRNNSELSLKLYSTV